jgi:glutathione peroxidase
MHRHIHVAAVALCALLATPSFAASPATPHRGGRAMAHGIYDFTMTTIDGSPKSLADYRGKALLVVNTASKCGLTPQYDGLEALYEKYRARGFEVLAFPANNFLFQEPGSNEQIKSFCSTQYHVTFPLFAKISVKGRDMAPLYQYLTKESPFPGDIGWNFAKFLVGPDGTIVARFDPKVDPLDAQVTSRLETVLPAH